MEEQNNNIGQWEAFKIGSDLITHVYVRGSVPTNGQKPILSLKLAHPQGIDKSQLILELSPDIVDPNGDQEILVEPFNERDANEVYDTVLIRTESNPRLAIITIERRANHSKQS